ncbi:MAG: metal-dependent hydrolase [Pirellulales bacterium]|nr:metal-dependent hydrolase [Pirellulales bacterium]
MAGFKTHITVSSVLGVGYGAAAYGYFHLPPSTCVLAAGLCGVSGMLPDLDSGPGRPLQETCMFASAAVPMLLIDHFEAWGLNREMMVIVGAAFYFLIRFGLPEVLKRLTVHRGVVHSLPTALIFGGLAFLLSSGADERLRLFKAGAVLLGFISHLILDEIWSVEFFSKHPGLKKSFGTAFKIFGKGWGPNLCNFALLGLITYTTLNEPMWLRQYCQQLPATNSRQATDESQKSQPITKSVSNWLNSWR